GRKGSFAAVTSGTRANISGTGRNNSGQQRVVKCFNYQGEGSGKVLNEEELEFLADPGVIEGLVTQTIITHNTAYQADDLDAYNSDCDDFSTAKAVLIANLSSYRSYVLSEIRPMLYDGSVIAKETNVISVADSEETLMLEEESRSKMLLKQSDPMIVVNSLLDMNTLVNVNFSVALNDSVYYVEMCNKCLELEAERIKQYNMVEKDEYNRLSKSFSKFEQHCISLELAMQLNKEIFQKNNTSMNQTEPSFDQLFKLNNLKAELQAKDTTIENLKANIKRLNKTSTINNVRKDIDEIETINIELEHRVAKILTENEHLKQTYKQLYDSIKPSSLKNDLRKFKGKDIVNNAVQVSNATTIALGMYKLDLVTLAPKDKNNKETHIYYLKHTMEQAAILWEIVEQSKSLNPLDSASYSTCKYVKLIQELLRYVRDTFRDIHKPSEKLVVVTPINKKKIVRHELCFLEFVSDMNASSKSKSVKKAKKKEEWKPTRKVFTKVGYN
nr:pyruvate, phosphate dikinase regulatory protein, chloroplastic [Tanacetum cinerariifolium]